MKIHSEAIYTFIPAIFTVPVLLLFLTRRFLNPMSLTLTLLEWERIKAQGNAPRNRFGHTSTMTAPKRLLIVGGQDVDSDEILFDDPILDLGISTISYILSTTNPNQKLSF